MAINVVVHRSANGSPVTEERYDSAAYFFVRENGVLVVTQTHFNDSPVVAVYAPGEWSTVQRVDEKAAAAAA